MQSFDGTLLCHLVSFLLPLSTDIFVQAAKGISSSSSYGSATLDKKDAAMAITQLTRMKTIPSEIWAIMVMYLCDVNPIIHNYKINKSTTENNYAISSMHIFDSSCYSRVMRGGAMSPSDLGTRARQLPCLHTHSWPTTHCPRHCDDVPGLSVAA